MIKHTRLHVCQIPNVGWRWAFQGEPGSIAVNASATEITASITPETLAPDRWGAVMAAAALMGWGDDYTLVQVPGKVVAKRWRGSFNFRQQAVYSEMNRVIKFRGIDPGTREWKYGDLIRVGVETRIFDGEHEWVIAPETAGQYIGTAAGREVYEGDVFQDKDGNAPPYQVVWVQDTARYGAKYIGRTFVTTWDIADAWRDRHVGTIHDAHLANTE